MTIGVLLINLGTPKKPTPKHVGAYLRKFLMDARVIDVPYIFRWLLVNLIIVPFRKKSSARAYQKIWTQKGSPLLIYSQRLKESVAMELGPNYKVVLSMRYGEPSIRSSLKRLARCKKIIILPLFPQHAEASSGTAIAQTKRMAKKLKIQAQLVVKEAFFDHPLYLAAKAKKVKRVLQEGLVDHVLFSYHGLPVRQIEKAAQCQSFCNQKTNCPGLSEKNAACYRAQCYATTAGLVKQVGLNEGEYSTVFQSRLGKTPWIQPYLDGTLSVLAEKGIKNIAVVCPSFVADCLETLEEIEIRAREQWKALGGGSFVMVPCVNDSQEWVQSLALITREMDNHHEVL